MGRRRVVESTAAIRARVRICQLAAARDAPGALIDQVVMELGDEVLDAHLRAQALRLAKLPMKATLITVVHVGTRRTRRTRA